MVQKNHGEIAIVGTTIGQESKSFYVANEENMVEKHASCGGHVFLCVQNHRSNI